MKSRKIIRMQGYDYSKGGCYFVTIEPIDRRYPFCEIFDGNIILNEIGRIIKNQWKWISDRYDHIKLDEYVIMPDHFHGIIRILPDSQLNEKRKSLFDSYLNVRATLESPSGNRAGPDPPVHLPKQFYNRLDLSHIIGAFKTTSSKLIHKAGYKDFKWKRSFYDRILRKDEIEIRRKYIRNNPIKWNSLRK